jgi:hypothetical protein
MLPSIVCWVLYVQGTLAFTQEQRAVRTFRRVEFELFLLFHGFKVGGLAKYKYETMNVEFQAKVGILGWARFFLENTIMLRNSISV